MAAELKGWISLHRSIQDHWLWQEKPYDRARAWIDLLLLVNHKAGEVLIGNELVVVEAGSHLTSQKKLMDRWGWGNTKVRNFLKILKDDGMIEYFGEKYTLIKIINYEMYQKQTELNPVISMDSQNPQTDNKLAANREQTDSKSQANTNNNDNNDNNINNINKEEESTPIKAYQNSIYPLPGMIEIEGIKKWSNDLGEDIVLYAIEIAVKANVRNWRFIEKILIDWDKNGIKTLNQAKAYSANRKRKGGNKHYDRNREDIREDKSQYNFNRPYTGPSYSDKDIDF